MEITITGIQYQMDSSDPKTRIEQANELVRNTPAGTPVTLRAEPDNPHDSNAIAVYLDYRRIGYVSSEDALLAGPCLGSEGSLTAPVVRGEEKTMWCEVEVDDHAVERIKDMPRRIQDSPFVGEVQMAFCKEERELEVLAEKLLQWKLQRRTVDEFRKLADAFQEVCCLSLCRMDALWQRLVYTKVRQAESLRLISKKQREQLMATEYFIQAALSRFHKADGHGEVLGEQLERLEASPEAATFFQRFDSYYLREPLGDASTAAVEDWEQRLQLWLEEVVGAEVRTKEWDMERLGHRLRYMNLSRREMYDILGVMMLLKRLRARLAGRNALELNEEERLALQKVLRLVKKTMWAEPANDEKVALFVRTLFGDNTLRLRAADRDWTKEFRNFFTTGRSGHGERCEIAYANLVGYMSRHGLVDGKLGLLSFEIFGTERQTSNINKGKNPPLKSRLLALERVMDHYRELIICPKKQATE